MTGPAVLLAPDDDRLGWLVAATRYAERAGLSVDAVTADVDTAARLHALGWTVLTSVWRVRLDKFRVVDLDRVPAGDDNPGEQRPRRLAPPGRRRAVRARWTRSD